MRLLGNSRLLVSSFAALIAGWWPAAARADTTVVNGAVVIPVNDDASPQDGSEADATVKGTLLSGGGQLQRRLQRAVQSGLVPVQGAPVRGSESRGESGGDEGRDGRGNVQINDRPWITSSPSIRK
jgi:hypothetical protein